MIGISSQDKNKYVNTMMTSVPHSATFICFEHNGLTNKVIRIPLFSVAGSSTKEDNCERHPPKVS